MKTSSIQYLREALEIVGGRNRLASMIGIGSPAAISNWFSRGSIPVEHCIAIEKATGGRVLCEDLRPDVDWRYLRTHPIEASVEVHPQAEEVLDEC